MNCLHIATLQRRISKSLWISTFSVLCAVQLLCSSASASQAGREFNEADAELNVTYKAVLASISNSQQRLKFIAAQKAWIKYRDENVAFYAEHYPDSKGGLFYNTDLTKERTAFLKQLLANPPQ
ncbi:MAG: lysozyme inhibitor LprI family protein [Prosthecobacter sp.]